MCLGTKENETVVVLMFDHEGHDKYIDKLPLEDYYVKIDNFISQKHQDKMLAEFSFCGRFNIDNLKP